MTPHDATRSGIGELTVVHHGLARDDRRDVPVGPLDEAACACGQVVHLFRLVEAQAFEVDHVHIRGFVS